MGLVLSVILCAAPGRPSVTVVARGHEAEVALSRLASDTELPVELRPVPFPSSVPVAAPLSEVADRLAQARKAYVRADFSSCLEALDEPSLVSSVLEQRERMLAARVLLWRTACEVGANRPDAARGPAEELVSLRLPTPYDVSQTTPDVEVVLATASRVVASRPLIPVEVRANVEGSVAIDGRPAVCTTPCQMELFEGTHVLEVSADGYTPEVRTLSVHPGRMAAEVTLESASPELAAAQWTSCAARDVVVDSSLSMRLLSISLRAPRLLLLFSGSPGVLRGALAVDGTVTARAERLDDAAGLVKDLLVRGRVVEDTPPLYRRPLFWAATGAVLVAAGIVIAVLVANRPVATHVELNP